jgi:hypothetical protein
MAETKSLEERVAAVERELAVLRVLLPQKIDPKNWIEKLTGSMKDFPEFDEVLRLGREIRQAELN